MVCLLHLPYCRYAWQEGFRLSSFKSCYFYDSELNNRKHVVCVMSVCLSVLTLIFAVTFQQER